MLKVRSHPTRSHLKRRPCVPLGHPESLGHVQNTVDVDSAKAWMTLGGVEGCQ